MPDRALARFGSISAITGGLLAVIVNLAHPLTIEVATTEGLLRDIAAAGKTFWLIDHMGIAVAALLWLWGLAAIYRSIPRDPGAAWARLGFVAAVVGISVGAVLVAQEFAIRDIAGAWSAVPETERAGVFQMASGALLVDLAMFYMFIIVFFGVAHVLYGLAILASNVFAHSLGWVAMAGGIGSLFVGMVHVFSGASVLMTNVLFVVFSVLLSLWVFMMGVALWRRSGATSG